MNVLVVVVVVAAIGLLFVVLYNGLAQLRVRADSAWSDIDIQLKRRHDLVPNLVETVKGYAAHEKGTFENVAKFRSAAMSAASPDERAQAEGGLTMALRGLLAVAEQYPQLRASEQFQSLQASSGAVGRCDSECAPLLQRRGSRFQYQDRDLPFQHHRRHVRVPSAQLLRTHRTNRPRCACREVLSAAGTNGRAGSPAWLGSLA